MKVMLDLSEVNPSLLNNVKLSQNKLVGMPFLQCSRVKSLECLLTLTFIFIYITITILFRYHRNFCFKSVHLFSADTPLLTSLDENDSVFNRTDESMNLPNDTEEGDVLTDMPRDSSAVNRFDRFLKERKDSELFNLMALRQGIDDGGAEEVEDIKVGY